MCIHAWGVHVRGSQRRRARLYLGLDLHADHQLELAVPRRVGLDEVLVEQVLARLDVGVRHLEAALRRDLVLVEIGGAHLRVHMPCT